eukprot:SAG31_NODE_616_length_13519_cov_2.372876_7_plen_149_part_00
MVRGVPQTLGDEDDPEEAGNELADESEFSRPQFLRPAIETYAAIEWAPDVDEAPSTSENTTKYSSRLARGPEPGRGFRVPRRPKRAVSASVKSVPAASATSPAVTGAPDGPSEDPLCAAPAPEVEADNESEASGSDGSLEDFLDDVLG